MNNQSKEPESRIAQDLRVLLDSDPPEEEIHQFFGEHILKIGHWNSPRRYIAGTISKFPITPDRIPDFVSILLNTRGTQYASRLTFIELKKASSALYTSHGRMSKDLNDGWMECVETSRLMAANFRDCLRRIVKKLDQKRLDEFNNLYNSSLGEKEKPYYYDDEIPSCNSVIVIGRRSSLDAEGLLRTRELSASTARAIEVITYDAVLDWVAEAGEDNRPFRAWYW